jgi:hypothetical protein
MHFDVPIYYNPFFYLFLAVMILLFIVGWLLIMLDEYKRETDKRKRNIDKTMGKYNFIEGD